MRFEEYLAVFSRHGDPGEAYLRMHYPRYVYTRNQAAPPGTPPLRVLDIGAHWLHHSGLYAVAGHKVTAAELPMMQGPATAALALELGIDTVAYRNLADPVELRALGENVFDVILFTEIIEHVTFNPVAMWKALYALLKPGGKIVVTTPNYFNPQEFLARDVFPVLRGRSSGLNVSEILASPDYGPHWKVYSAGDLRRYFGLLSPDFDVTIRYFNYAEPSPQRSPLRRVARAVLNGVQRVLPVSRQAVYVEARLPEKSHGITLSPHW